MPDLSSEAQALVRTGRRAYRPSEADRGRVLEALRGRLGDAVVLGVAAPPSSPSIAPAKVIRVALSHWKTMGIAAFAGGSLLFGLRFADGHASSLPRVPRVGSVGAEGASQLLAPSDDLPLADVPTRADEILAAQASDAKPAPLVETRPVPSRRMHDGLSDEIAILSRAETELHGGRPESALVALDEHERRFPNGVLSEERTAARIQALCALGRTAEADAQLARLARISPHSAHEERARQACRESGSPAP